MVALSTANISTVLPKENEYPQVNSSVSNQHWMPGLTEVLEAVVNSLAQQRATDPSANELICHDSCSDSDNCHFPQGFQSTKADNSFVKGLCESVRQGHAA